MKAITINTTPITGKRNQNVRTIAAYDPSGRGPTAIAMDEGGGTTSSIGRPQALDLPDGAIREPGGFGDE